MGATIVAAGVPSCANTNTKRESGAEALPAPLKLNPTALEVGAAPSGALSMFQGARWSAAPPEAWALFDRDTATGFTPKLDGEGVLILRVSLDGPSAITHIKVFGPSPYVLDVLADGDAVGPLESIDLSRLKPGWNVLPVSKAAEPETIAAALELHFKAKAPPGAAAAPPITDLELWSVRQGSLPRVSTDSLRDLLEAPDGTLPAHVTAWTATPAMATLEADEETIQAPCAAFTFTMSRPPALYRSAWLAFHGKGLFRAFAVTRALNNAPKKPGHWLASDEPGPELFVEPVDPEQLRFGENRYEVCLPSDAVGKVDISDVRFFGELEHGTNAVEAVAIGLVGATPTLGASSLLDPASTESHTIEPGERALVVFERWVSPDGIIIGSNRMKWSVECLDETGKGAPLPLDEAGSEGDSQLLVARHSEGERVCAGLSLSPSGSAKVKYLSVVGSGARQRLDWPHIVLASPPEHFGLAAWVDGWASAPTKLGGTVHVDVDSADAGTEAGAFAQVISRSGDPNVAWPVTLTAHYGDQSTFSRRFVLESADDVALLAGLGPGLVPGASDGLTEEQRAERFGTVWQTVSLDADQNATTKVRLGSQVGVDVPAGAVKGNSTTVTVGHLDARDLPPLDPGMINVTAPAAHGYEFLPHGQTFSKPVKLLLPYQKNLIPRGYSARDVVTFFFDEESKSWRSLSKDSIDEAQATVQSSSDHFTVMINAVVVAPEHPQISGFNPNQIKDVKVADPGTRINLIEPPGATSKGDAVVSYPIELPPGRNGLDPELALQYNSSGGNSWMGVGWDLAKRTVSIDTRWGVPRYDGSDETETYLVEGEQLAPIAYRGPVRKRADDLETFGGCSNLKVFHTRVESEFRKIIRHGGSPTSYWWEVIDKTGMRFFYGARPGALNPCATQPDSQAILRVPNNASTSHKGIYEWALTEVRDTHGNSVRYHYELAAVDADDPRKGQELYLSRIDYTVPPGVAQGGEDGPYHVTFAHSATRPDVLIDGRGGFKRVTSGLLRGIRVSLGSTPIRSYSFAYTTGAFNKSLLQKISQFGANGQLFNEHTLGYHNEISEDPASPTTAYKGFGNAQDHPTAGFNTGNDDVAIGFGPFNTKIPLLGEGKATSLSGAQSASFGGHLYLGFNPFSPTKQNSFGFKVGYSESRTTGRLQFIDLNGDGLPDKVFGNPDGPFNYRLNQSGPDGGLDFSGGSALAAAGLPNLFKERAKTTSAGAEAYPLIFGIMLNFANTFSTATTYFSDVNGDGLPDVVSNGQVYFNQRVETPPGSGVFLQKFVLGSSAGTPFPVESGAVFSDGLLPTDQFEQIRAEDEKKFPLADSVRLWEAPYTGKIGITGNLALAHPHGSAEEIAEFGYDGVRVAIERAGVFGAGGASELWSTEIEPGDSSEKTPDNVDELDVQKGQRIYFRVGSRDNGFGDEVSWTPHIQYLDEPNPNQTDANGLSVFVYQPTSDFILGGRRVQVTMPYRGSIHIGGRVALARETTDDVTLFVLKTRDTQQTIVFQHTFSHGTPDAVDLDVDEVVVKDDIFEAYLSSDSPIDLTAIELGSSGNDFPQLHYVAAETEDGEDIPVDDNGTPLFKFELPVDMRIFPLELKFPSEDGKPLSPYTVRECQRLRVFPNTSVIFDASFTIKKAGVSPGAALIHKGSPNASVDIDVQEGERYFFEFSTASPLSVFSSASVFVLCIVPPPPDAADPPPDPSSPELVTTALHAASPVDRCSVPYRGWAYGGYNANNGDDALLPISEKFCQLSASDLSNEDTDPDDHPVPGSQQELEDSNANGDINTIKNSETATFIFTPRYEFPCRNDPAANIFAPPQCQRPSGEPMWTGPDEYLYITKAAISSSRLGADDLRVPGTGDALGGPERPVVSTAPARISHSSQATLGGSAGVLGLDFSGSVTPVLPPPLPTAFDNSMAAQLEFMDMNGDRFPDIVSAGGVQYTSARGALDAGREFPANDFRIRESSNKGASVGIGGTPLAIAGSARALAAPEGNRSAETAGSKHQMPSLGLSLSGTGSSTTVTDDLQDINGDGLPDILHVENGKLIVQLNLGYYFGEAETWGDLQPGSKLDGNGISVGNSTQVNVGVSLGFNDGIYGYAGGVSGGFGNAGVKENLPSILAKLQDKGATLLDINGDGLLDLLVPGSTSFTVAINTGAGFSTPVAWNGIAQGEHADISHSSERNLGEGVYFTIPIGPLCLAACYLIINPGLDNANAMNRQETLVQDIDGDGYPDHLASDNPSQIDARINLTGKTNLLAQIARPLGATIDIDYERKGNTYEQPQSRWVVSKVHVFDGLAGDGVDNLETRFSYGRGRFDRREREFYGFDQVVEDRVDTRVVNNPPAYRRVTRDYHNQNFFSKGLLAREEVKGLAAEFAGEQVFSVTTNAFQLKNLGTGTFLNPAAPAEDAHGIFSAVFPELRSVQKTRSERLADGSTGSETISTEVRHQYDLLGNVVDVVDLGDAGVTDDFHAVISYTTGDASCADRYIVGLANSIIVTNTAGATLRRREADFDCAGGTGHMDRLRQFFDGTGFAQTDFAFEPNGNLSSIEGPENHRLQRYKLELSYDSVVQSHVTGVSDSFENSSSSDYDFRFGQETESVDENGQRISRTFDDFGRLQDLTGPFEQNTGHKTIAFDYQPAAAVPYAVTRHFDGFRDPSGADTIDTILFTDGLRRVVQTKKDATIHASPSAALGVDVMVVSGRVLFDHVGRVRETRYPIVERPKDPSLVAHVAFNPTPDPVASTQSTLDEVDRVISTTLPDLTTTSNRYEIGTDHGGVRRLATTTTDAQNGRKVRYRDIREQIRSIKELNGPQTIWTDYEYDPIQQLTAIRDDHGNLTRVVYDVLGRRTLIDNPDTGPTRMEYDSASNLRRKITAALAAQGGAITYGYDHKRVVSIQHTNFPETDVSYTYGGSELLGNGKNQVARVIRVTDESGSEERSYGRLGEVIEEVKTIASDTLGQSPNSPEVYRTRYLYDTWGRAQQMTYPDGEVLTYAYDSGGLPRQARGVKLGVTFAYMERLEYDKFNQRAFMVTGNGIPTTYRHDEKTRRLSELEAADFQHLVYGYDLVGNLTSRSNQVNPVRPSDMGGPVDQTFAYDDLNRLTSASGEWRFAPNKRDTYSLTMSYDTVHNITRKTQSHNVENAGNAVIPQKKTSYDSSYDYTSLHPHAPTTIGSRAYQYDANGNQIRWDEQQNGQRRTVVWDDENRIQSISDNGHTMRYKYDDTGERVIKRGPQGETAYVNQFWTVRNRSIGTKHVFVGAMRVSSKLSPGEAHVNPPGRRSNDDLLVGMVGNWLEHRSESGLEHGQNVNKNPHITGCVPPRCDSVMPPGDQGLPDANFVYFYHPDHLGSTQFATDKDGELFEHMEYFPFGESWVAENTNTQRLPYLFTSKEFDEETELYYFGARYYDPRTSVWQNTDPALADYLPDDGVEQGLPGMGGVYNPGNLALYTYAGLNPLILIDFIGLSKEDVEKIVKAITADMNKAWTKSFKKDGSVREVGAAIVKMGDVISTKNEKEGGSGSISIDMRVVTGESLLGSFHTHPYSKTEGSHTGVAFSGPDIANLAGGDQGSYKLIEAGTKRFALEVKDAAKFEAFAKSHDIKKMWDDKFKTTKGNLQDRVRETVKSIAQTKDSGLQFYQSTDKDKLKFEEVK